MKFNIMKNIYTQVMQKNNDYTKIEKNFREKTGLEITNITNVSKYLQPVSESLTIIIPSYKGSKYLSRTLSSILKQTYTNYEIIIVDDGSPIDAFKGINSVGKQVNVKLVKSVHNQGSAAARNIGLNLAEGKYIVFLDDDMVLGDENILLKLALRQKFAKNSVFIGFRQNLSNMYTDKITAPLLSADWRYKVIANENFIPICLTPPNHYPNDRYYLINDTNSFKTFGNGRVIGYWDLPSMIIGHSICAEKETIIRVGGFPEKYFRDWGMEDIAFGASLIAAGNYVIPALDWVSFHQYHEGRKLSREEQMDSLKKNLIVYRQFVGTNIAESRLELKKINYLSSRRNFKYYEY